jgi:hypothetical protein
VSVTSFTAFFRPDWPSEPHENGENRGENRGENGAALVDMSASVSDAVRPDKRLMMRAFRRIAA